MDLAWTVLKSIAASCSTSQTINSSSSFSFQALCKAAVALMEIVKKLDFADISLHEPQNLRVQEVIQAVTEPSVERLAQYAGSQLKSCCAGRTLCTCHDTQKPAGRLTTFRHLLIRGL